MFGFRLARKRMARGSRAIAASTVSRLECLENRTLLSAVTVQVAAVGDTTIYDLQNGDIANGRGEFLLTGGEGSDEVAHRTLISFDLFAAGIPAGATILDVTLTLNLAWSIGGSANVDLYRMLNAWGEGASDAIDDEINGTQAEAGDATWLYRFFNASLWNNPGGDFASGASASVNVGTPGTYVWSDEVMVADVQQWLDDSNSNFGWMLLSESVPGTLKAFNSRDSSNAAMRPALEITYEEPVLPALIAGRTWNDTNADGLRVPQSVQDLRLYFQAGKDYFNTYRGQELWYRSAVDNGWYIFTPDGSLTRWDNTPAQLTGTHITTLPVRFYHASNPRMLVEGAHSAEPWVNGITIELIDQFGVVVQTTVTADYDANQDGLIDPETETGWYRFQGMPEGDYLVRQVVPTSRTASVSAYAGLAKHVHDLDTQLQLRFHHSLYENAGGKHERWILGNPGWYYVLPSGGLYRWNGRAITAENPLTGTWMLDLGPAYYRDPSLIYGTQSPVVSARENAPLTDISFGSFPAITVSGRVWHDRNADGLQSSEEFITVHQIAAPQGNVPAAARYWYQSATAASLPDAPCFYADQYGNLYAWSQTAGATFVTQLWGGFEDSAQVVLDVGFITEPYQNGWTLELVDTVGRVVATTVSGDVDRNGNQQIEPATERGWYVFRDVLPGEYHVRQVGSEGWVRTSQMTAVQSTLVTQLQHELGFKRALSDWYNFGLRHERWFQGRNNQWYYITPDGSVYDWDRRSGGAKGVVNGTKIATLSSGYYLNLQLLFRPPTASMSVHGGMDLAGGDFGNHRIIDGLFAEIAELLQDD